MLSTFPVPFPGDSFFSNPFLTFEPGSLPWEHHEPGLPFHPPNVDEPAVLIPQPCPEPASSASGSGSDTSNLAPSPGSNEPFRVKTFTSKTGPIRRNSEKLVSPGSDETSPLDPVVDDKKLRRMISNRDSARRSRMRKQKHLEDLRDQVNRNKVVNRELMNRLRLVVHQTQMFCAENEFLRSEAAVLRQRLWDVRQVLLTRQLLNQPSVNNPGLYSINSLIT
ncbi:basic-leucine zipper transcription factor family protein [Striga asiatica]|uniref:Basic-leucine zipper transcription factor family protein n=1 Tax=Striga asiatica TaxID=4170 RepID=A0A5A7PDH3_STRAF|nr:basic-leucine zipper transcription factor family protein [Striga asiatica]